MTKTQDGDGLSLREHCVRWLRRKRVTAELSTADLKIKAKEFERNIGADAEQMLSAAAQPGEIDGYPHSALATPPSTNGAEGEGDRWAHLDNADMTGATFKGELSATPQPAPDAMREALIAEYVRFAERLINQEGRTAEWHASAKGLPQAIAALSAPAASPDGAGEALRLLLKFTDACYLAFDDSETSSDDTVTLDADKAKDVFDCIDALNALPDDQPGYVMSWAAKVRWALRPSPSATGAAEPVAWNCIYPSHGHFTLRKYEADQARLDGAQVIPLYAATPVREDREAIARCIFKRRMKVGDQTADMYFGKYAADPTGLEHMIVGVYSAFQDADAILSLPSAPVSDESVWLNAYADAHLQLAAFKKATGNLVLMARTSGGVAGRDDGLCAACDDVERLISDAKPLPAAPVSGRDAAIEEKPQYEFPYQQTFDSIAAATDVLSGPPNQQLSISVKKFQAAFNGHRLHRAIRALSNHKESGR